MAEADGQEITLSSMGEIAMSAARRGIDAAVQQYLGVREHLSGNGMKPGKDACVDALASREEAAKAYREAVEAMAILSRINAGDNVGLDKIGNAGDYGEINPLSVAEAEMLRVENPENFVYGLEFSRLHGRDAGKAAACYTIVKMRDAAQKEEKARAAMYALIRRARKLEETCKRGRRYSGPKMGPRHLGKKGANGKNLTPKMVRAMRIL